MEKIALKFLYARGKATATATTTITNTRIARLPAINPNKCTR